ncbi:MAG: phosphoenolpyruvate--protein phosphotransferase [Pseudomonadota bacterium]
MKKAATKNETHINLLCDVSNLASLLTGSVDMKGFLQQVVEMVAARLKADVCSIYLYDEENNELVLTATQGLNPESVGKIKLKPGEGIVGATHEGVLPICVGDVDESQEFKYFEEAKEDSFTSFLSVPLQRGVESIGVISLQHEKKNYFNEIDVTALRAVASQLASSVENARLLLSLHDLVAREKTTSEQLQFIKGEVASDGFSYAPAMVIKKKGRSLLLNSLSTAGSGYGLADFRRAVNKTGVQLQKLQKDFSSRLPESASLIFTAHFMILKDPGFIQKIEDIIQLGTDPIEAVCRIAVQYISLFTSNPHPYIAEKANDVEDLALRILKNFQKENPIETELGEKKIVIAEKLFPSDILNLVTNDVKGIILVGGGITSHISILSRSLKIPLVIVEEPLLIQIQDDTPVLLDADLGNIYIRPSKEILEKFERKNRLKEDTISNAIMMDPVTRTIDGTRVNLFANINLLTEVSVANQLKAEGIGLYRSEFPFLIRSTFPSETEQYLVYRHLFNELQGKEVTIRTLDVGGEKTLAYFDMPEEQNPELGMRSIRFSLKHKDVFQHQIRAILRAASDAGSTARIMFPMISSLDEFYEARNVVFDCIQQLEEKKFACNHHPQIGMMIELPAIVELMEDFSKEVDFFSIGTNDFVQYMLAVDRTNRMVSDYYCPFHPSVLRALSKIVRIARQFQVDISVCGEMTHDLSFLSFLLGIGIRKISVDPQFLPDLQKRIQKLLISDMEKYSNRLLAESSLQKIKTLIN